MQLEFGSLTHQQPVGRHAITPCLADAFPEAIPDWQCDVVALGIDRTFWEKATILHAEHHRPAGKATRDRFSRHYADVAALALHPATEHAIADIETCERVVGWKRLFFGSARASSDTACPGSFRLLPSDERLASNSCLRVMIKLSASRSSYTVTVGQCPARTICAASRSLFPRCDMRNRHNV